MSRAKARAIWQAAVDAVRPAVLLRDAVGDLDGRRIVVMGAGKAGAAMSVALEVALGERLDKVVGWVNVPAGTEVARPVGRVSDPVEGEPAADALPSRRHSSLSRAGDPAYGPTRRIHLHPARPPASNHPTEAGVAGSREILRLAREAGPDDLGVCLWSGGGSALLPAPVDGISLADKQLVTRLLHQCGATINEMNSVRKHLSAIKGGRLAEAFNGRRLVSFIVSDVVGDPLDVIASGPTAPDPTTFADAWGVIEKFELQGKVPVGVRDHLRRGMAGDVSETPKSLPATVENRIVGNNAIALAAAEAKARSLGYPAVLNHGSRIEGEASEWAAFISKITATIAGDAPLCLIWGGETTVTLGDCHGKGGRNQEFVLAFLDAMGRDKMKGVVVLSGGTDGEDGPTDAAGAIADAGTFDRAAALDLDLGDYLRRHDAYEFFAKTGDLLVTGPTGTNVMDVGVILIDKEPS